MKQFCNAFILYLLLLVVPSGLVAGEPMKTDSRVSHDLRVVLAPDEHRSLRPIR